MICLKLKTLRNVLFLSATLPLLAACQSACSGDARTDDYWCARSNLNKGVYAAQTAKLQSVASLRQHEQQDARALLSQRQAELAAARASSASSTEIARLEAEVASLRLQVQSLMQ